MRLNACVVLILLTACAEKQSPPPASPPAASAQPAALPNPPEPQPAPAAVTKQTEPACQLDLRLALLGRGDLASLELPLGACEFAPGVPSLHTLTRDELRLARNAISARRGLRFKSKDLARFFARYSWYKPDADAVDDRLTALDRENIAALLAAEKRERTLPPEGRLGIAAELRLREEEPGGGGGTFVLLEDGSARYEWENPGDREHRVQVDGRWTIDWPHLIVSWNRERGTRGLGEGHVPPTAGNVPLVYARREAFQQAVLTTTIFDWVSTESDLIYLAASQLNVEPEALRSRLRRGEVTPAAVERAAPSAYAMWLLAQSSGDIDCATVVCRLPDGQPCTACRKAAGGR